MNNTLLARFSSSPCLVAPAASNRFEAALNAIAGHERSMELLTANAYAEDSYWPSADDWRAAYRPYVVRDGVLQIPVKGVLLHDFPWALGSWATGYIYIAKAIERGLADGNVKAIALIVDSFGGEVAGCFEAADKIFAARDTKPIQAFAHESAYSAGYAIACSASKITMSTTGGVGSVGVVTAHLDVSGAMSQAGLKVTFIYAGKHKVDGNPYEPLSKDVAADIQEDIDDIYGVFTALVARNRGLDDAAVRATEARCFNAKKATANGFVDGVGPLEDAVAQFTNDLSKADNEGEDEMSKDTNASAAPAASKEVLDAARAEGRADAVAANAEAVTAAVVAERGRIGAILGSEEAAGRDDQAKHIAFETDMSADAAKAMLAKAPKAEAAKPAAEKNRFEQAMDAKGNPKVGPDGGPTAPAATGEEAEANAEAAAIVATLGGNKAAA